MAIVSDDAVLGNLNKKLNSSSKSQAFTGTINFNFTMDDLINQMDGAETQMTCEYGDAAKWQRDRSHEFKFTLKPYLEYPLE